MIKLSCILPAYNEQIFLHKTIDSLLENSELPKNELEIVVILDGYEPEKPIINDPRVKVFRQENKGMREAINRGVKESRGEFIMRLDTHQMVGPGYDRILTRDCQDNWIMTPRRYHLDVEKWEIMNEIAPIDYDRLAIQQSRQKFTGVESRGTAKARKDIMIDETFGMQGSCWIMKRSWWDKVIQELDTKNYGPLYGDSTEMIFKTWKAGGKLMVNKNTWHAHKHRKFKRTHNDGSPENPSRKEEGFAYALKTWGDYFREIDGKTINVWPPISQ